MTRRFCLAAAVAVVVGAGPALAQYDLPGTRPAAPSRPLEDPKPVYKYELKPENGEYLVVVRTFLGEIPGDRKPKELAEGLAEWIRSECRLYAFVHERGWLMRRERDKEKEAVISAKKKYYESKGLSGDQITPKMLEVKMARITDEYAVLVAPGKGTLKSMDEALDFAKYVRKLPCPPADFCDSIVVASSVDLVRSKGDLQNPFPKAFAGHNPTLPKKETATERPKANELLMRLNGGQPYSLIHKTKKPFTLVVQTYATKLHPVLRPGQAVQEDGPSDGELMERVAQQANALAEVLRKQRDPAWDAYVLHTKYESFVCVGEYDTKDDAQLLFAKKLLAGRQFRDQKTGQIIETLMAEPMPAMIPRP